MWKNAFLEQKAELFSEKSRCQARSFSKFSTNQPGFFAFLSSSQVSTVPFPFFSQAPPPFICYGMSVLTVPERTLLNGSPSPANSVDLRVM